MVKYSNLATGEKIRHVREAKGLSIENMADAIGSSKSSISRFERGDIEFSAETLTAMRRFLGIEKAPLMEHELDAYKNRIHVWKQYIIEGRFAEAKAMQEEMSEILDLSFEHDLYLLYLVSEALLFGMEYNIPVAEEKLSFVEGLLENASDEVVNLYHLNKGFLCAYAGDLISCLKHSLIAVDHAEANKGAAGSALMNIGQAYMFLGKPHQAIRYVERSKASHTGNITMDTSAIMWNALGKCYLLVGEHRNAEEALKLALAKSKSVNARDLTGEILSNMAQLKLKIGMHEECMNLCDQAQAYLENEHMGMYLDTLTIKANCLCEMKRYDECRELLTLIRAMIREGNTDVMMADMSDDDRTIKLNAISHLMSLDESDSANYIQDIVIPHFRAGGMIKFDALYYCRKLEAHYTKKRAKTKANAIAAISRDIYHEIFLTEVVFD